MERCYNDATLIPGVMYYRSQIKEFLFFCNFDSYFGLCLSNPYSWTNTFVCIHISPIVLGCNHQTNNLRKTLVMIIINQINIYGKNSQQRWQQKIMILMMMSSDILLLLLLMMMMIVLLPSQSPK